MMFKVCIIKPSGMVDPNPISTETAAKKDKEAFLKLYQEMQLTYQKHFEQQKVVAQYDYEQLSF